MSHPFICQKPPKSTGRETFGEKFLEKVLKRADEFRLNKSDIIATLTAFTAESIANALKRFVLRKVKRLMKLSSAVVAQIISH